MNNDVIGAVVAVVIYCGCIVVFLSRLSSSETVENWAGLFVTAMAVPLVALWVTSPGAGYPAIYHLQLALILVFLGVEFTLDYALESDFRNVRWMVIAYVTLFFASTGGMIGVASRAGAGWGYAAIALYLTMSILAFYQRAKTGK